MGRPPSDHEPDADGRLLQACLCEDAVGRRPATDIAAGIGWQCSPTCRPPQRPETTP